ncbi:hypothetical protein A5836_002695, partial [Enterococcus faecium]
MRNCCGINTLSVLKTFCLMYDNLPKILSHTLSRQSCLQLLMYYLICNYRPFFFSYTFLACKTPKFVYSL